MPKHNEEVDWEDPEVDERWCNEQRKVVKEYLHSQGVKYRSIGDYPAWHVPRSLRFGRLKVAHGRTGSAGGSSQATCPRIIYQSAKWNRRNIREKRCEFLPKNGKSMCMRGSRAWTIPAPLSNRACASTARRCLKQELICFSNGLMMTKTGKSRTIDCEDHDAIAFLFVIEIRAMHISPN